jgi:protein SCO1
MLRSWQRWRGLVIAATAAVMVLAAPDVARAAPEDFVTPAPPEIDAIRVDEQLGAQVPLELAFRDQSGNRVVLGDLIKGDLPVVLTFNYSNCPMLCSMQLNGLIDVLPKLSLVAGGQFRIITIVLEPKETPGGAQAMRNMYIQRLADRRKELREPAEYGGWTYLVAETPDDDAAIRRVAETVGFGYRYLPDQAEFAHPAALIFLSPSGKVTRYMHGIEYDPADLFTSLVRAGTAEPSASVGFVQRCFHWEPPSTAGARTGQAVMRFGALAFAGLMISALFVVHFLRRDHARRNSSPSGGARS